MQAIVIIQQAVKEDAVSGRFINLNFYPALERLAKDPVPNLRFNAAQLFEKLYHRFLP